MNASQEDQQAEVVFNKDEFPWEFTVPLTADVNAFTFSLNGYKPDGMSVNITPPATLRR
jgi:hypothetical protein